MKNIILASRSIDRGKILHEAKVSFNMLITNLDEEPYKRQYRSNPIKLVEELAKAKVKNAKERLEVEGKEAVIIGADTIVEIAGEILGKPKNEQEAFEMIKKLVNKTHKLITGLAISETNNKKQVFSHDITSVKLINLNDDEIREYVQTGEWKGRAGGYSIRDKAGLFIESIEGSNSNVVGLPLHKVFEILKEKFDLNLFKENVFHQ